MKFEEVYGRTHRGGLSQAEAAEVLGVSERTFRRWRDRYEAEGADGLYDRRLGWTPLTKVETSCDRILIAGGANVEAKWEQGPAV